MTNDRGTRDSVAQGSTRGSHMGKMPATSVRRSRQSAMTGKGMSKGDHPGGGPAVKDPEDGKIRTPKGLLTAGPIQVPAKHVAGLMSTINDEGLMSRMTAASDISEGNLPSFPSFGNFSVVGSTTTPSASEAGEDVGRQTLPGAPSNDQGSAGRPATHESAAPPAEPMLTQHDLDRITTVTLHETNTFTLLDMPPLVVQQDTEEGAKAEATNKAYEELLEAKVGNDSYIDASAQTVDNMMVLRKPKEVQTETADTTSTGAQWDVGSAEQSVAEEAPAEQATAAVSARFAFHSSKANGSVVANGSMMGSMLASSRFDPGASFANSMHSSALESAMESTAGRGAAAVVAALQDLSAEAAPEGQQLQTLPGLKDALATMESYVLHSTHLDAMLMYRSLQPLSSMLGDWVPRPRRCIEPPAAPEPSDSCIYVHPLETIELPDANRTTEPMMQHAGETVTTEQEGEAAPPATPPPPPESLGTTSNDRMQLLWQWKCDLTAGRSVACAAWNHERADLVAVGYGSFDFGQHGDGLVCLWSMKNPQYPLWWFRVASGVTCLAFSRASGGVLAIGTYDGNIAVYDIKAQSGEPAISSDGIPGKHTDPVWKVQWLDTSDTAAELASISTDGRVMRWKITKGLEHTDLMKLKHVPRRDAVYTSPRMANLARTLKQEAFISRLTAGTAFAFSADDERVYVAGTEDGWIHRCSTAYSEQYMFSYKGHMGPVYNLQWAPYKPSLFVSCSADWTVRLWSAERETPLLTFQHGSTEVHDVQWCPHNSTVFATATESGSAEVWDFAESTLRPVTVHSKLGMRMTCVAFCESNATLLCGDSAGGVSVLRLFDIVREQDSDEEQIKRLSAAMDANVMKTEPVAGDSRSPSP